MLLKLRRLARSFSPVQMKSLSLSAYLSPNNDAIVLREIFAVPWIKRTRVRLHVAFLCPHPLRNWSENTVFGRTNLVCCRVIVHLFLSRQVTHDFYRTVFASLISNSIFSYLSKFCEIFFLTFRIQNSFLLILTLLVFIFTVLTVESFGCKQFPFGIRLSHK